MSHNTGYFFEKTSLSRKTKCSGNSARNQRTRSLMFKVPWHPEFSPVEFLKGLAERVKKAVCFGSARRRSLNRSLSPSTGISTKLARSSSVDYHRTAAVEDCIEFIHTSFSKSNSSTMASASTSKDEFMHAFLRKFESRTL